MDDLARYKQLASDVYVYGSVSLALAMARETKMVHSLCTAEDPLTSTQIASQLNLKKRYVRELLNSLTVAGLVQLEAGTGGKEELEARYWVPPTCRQMLQNASTKTLVISSNARNFAGVRKCFDLDGPCGVRYEATTFEAMDEIARMKLDHTIEAVLKTPGLKLRLETGLRALDVGCGRGTVSLRMAAMYPNSHFTLSDLMPEPLEQARRKAEEQRLPNVSFQLLDVCHMPDDLRDTFDWVLARNVIHDLPYPSKALREICKVLKSGSNCSLVDIFVSSYVAKNVENKMTAALYSLSTFSCVPESYQQPDSEALGACWGSEKAKELVEAAGMKVLGLTRIEEMGVKVSGVCMSLKPE